MECITKINLTDDPLKNIMLMTPQLDETGQNRVLGLVFGLMAGKDDKEKSAQDSEGLKSG